MWSVITYDVDKNQTQFKEELKALGWLDKHANHALPSTTLIKPLEVSTEAEAKEEGYIALVAAAKSAKCSLTKYFALGAKIPPASVVFRSL